MILVGPISKQGMQRDIRDPDTRNLLTASTVLTADAAPRAWSSAMLRDEAAWPHSEQEARITVTTDGLCVEVPPGRTWAIAAASHLLLPENLGRIRVRIAKIAGDARWFLRLYGELREPGRR